MPRGLQTDTQTLKTNQHTNTQTNKYTNTQTNQHKKKQSHPPGTISLQHAQPHPLPAMCHPSCGSMNDARRRNISGINAFYNSRAKRMRTVSLPTTAAAGGVFAPLRLEARLDDNYMTRAICGFDASFDLPGNDAFGLDAPVSEPHLRCAMAHLYYDYSLIGVTNRCLRWGG